MYMKTPEYALLLLMTSGIKGTYNTRATHTYTPWHGASQYNILKKCQKMDEQVPNLYYRANIRLYTRIIKIQYYNFFRRTFAVI